MPWFHSRRRPAATAADPAPDETEADVGRGLVPARPLSRHLVTGVDPAGLSGASAPPPPDDHQAEPAHQFSAMLIAEIPRLRRYATAWLGNAADADDLVQDCMERAIERRETLRDPGRLGGWLLAILHNLHVSGVRRRQRRSHLVVGLHTLEDELLRHAPPADRERMGDLVRAMGQLSEDHRQILLLVALEGLSYREIADILEVPLGTVMSRLSRARETLRELMQEARQASGRRTE